MTVKSGFFNSLNLDREYDADEFSSFYDGLISDGVYSSVGTRFYVSAYGGMKVCVDTGRAWFDHTWTVNSQKLLLELDTADTLYRRIDAVVIEVNKTDRENYIKIVKGTPAQNPARPTLTKNTKVIQYALAYIMVPVNTTAIVADNITNVVGTVETPLITMLNVQGLPPMQFSETDIEAGVTPLYSGQLYLVYE